MDYPFLSYTRRYSLEKDREGYFYNFLPSPGFSSIIYMSKNKSASGGVKKVTKLKKFESYHAKS